MWIKLDWLGTWYLCLNACIFHHVVAWSEGCVNLIISIYFHQIFFTFIYLFYLPSVNIKFWWLFYFLEQLESTKSRKLNNVYMRVARISWQLLLLPWRLLFAFVPPYHITHGWIAFICSLIFISGIAYVVTQLTDLISCVTGFLPLPAPFIWLMTIWFCL